MQTLNENQIFNQIAKEVGDAKKASNQTGITNEVLKDSDELSILNQRLVQQNIYVDRTNNNIKIYLAGDKVSYKVSRKGYIYIQIKNITVSGSIRQILLRTMYENSQAMGNAIKLGSNILEPITYNNTPLHVAWDSDCATIKYICDEDIGKNEIRKFEKSRLYKENQRTSSNDNAILHDKDEVYGDSDPELFIENTDELEELLQVILDIKLRKRSVEEIELLKEIRSEIDKMI